MLETKKGVIYKAFGFNIFSEIPMPELPQINMKECLIDVEIRVDYNFHFQLLDVPYKHVVQGKKVMFYIPNIALFSVQDGKKITISPENEIDEDLIRLFVLGTCMGIVLMQRKILPLHGSAIMIKGKAYGFIGESGRGKSTLAAGLLNLGYQLLSDDVIAVSLAENSIPHVIPSYPQQKLWQKSLEHFGMHASEYKPLVGRGNKYSIPVDAYYCSNPVPLAGLFELVIAENEKIEIRQIEKLEQLHTLFCQTYRNFLIPRLELMEWHFDVSAKIIQYIDMYQLHRPEIEFTVSRLASLILKTIDERE
ncbi:aldolase [Bacillus cereus]|uniref:aldolase n=1 Tax=Bacillus nitratireducens TaxID=2026193 RepID=UPI000BEBCE59|nr:aldolase [Bacillus nitratireducens]PEA20186.1 aldolase [Bacillus cereus]PFB98609.1 aldolase [Bacillus cereus]